MGSRRSAQGQHPRHRSCGQGRLPPTSPLRSAGLRPDAAGAQAGAGPRAPPSHRVVANNPVAQRLTLHATGLRRHPPRMPIQHHGNGQNAPRLLGVSRSRRRRPQLGNTQTLGCNLNCRHAARSANQRHAASSHVCDVWESPQESGSRAGGIIHTVIREPLARHRPLPGFLTRVVAQRGRLGTGNSLTTSVPVFGLRGIGARPFFNHPIGVMPTPQCSRGSMQLSLKRIQDGCIRGPQLQVKCEAFYVHPRIAYAPCTPFGTKSSQDHRSDAGRLHPTQRLSLGPVHRALPHRQVTKSWKDCRSNAGRPHQTERVSLGPVHHPVHPPPRARGKSLICSQSSSLINPLRT